jgi:PPOX class probable F420-dependent enzyme
MRDSDVRPPNRPGLSRSLRGMTTSATLDPAARVDGLLRREPIVWLSTVRPDGTPHLVPIWFSWDGERLFVASKRTARKVRNLRANPKLMLALGEPDGDFDVGLVEAEAELPDVTTAELLPAGHLRKYRERMAAIGLDAETYLRDYSQPILIRPTRFLPWHGRTAPPSASRPSADAPPALRRVVDRLLAPLGLRRPLPDFGAAAG